MSRKNLKYQAVIFPLIIAVGAAIFYKLIRHSKNNTPNPITAEITWQAPDVDLLPACPEADQIRYGKELIAGTSKYLGPKGSVAKISNGMDCQHCHIDAGTRPYGNSFGAVASTYPKYRDRSGRIETVEYRINECMERSLNGKKLDSSGKEMKAMAAYINWLGKDVAKGVKPPGTGVPEVPFLIRASDTGKGKIIFISKCQRCHGANGAGQMKPDSTGYVYPPLWGPQSYNVSAGLYRLSRFAGFVKYNMPFTAMPSQPQLTDEEAWDVAAYVNSRQRPERYFSYDWMKINTKPVDYPFGPFADSFTALQHKYGPFNEMKKHKR